MLERILYVSRAAPGTELSNIFRIVSEARERNAAAGISGALVFVDGWFAQVLEGPAPAICATYARILADPRHVDISFRARERALCRLFDDGLVLRTGPKLRPEVLREFDYSFGFPVETFPADVLLEFMVWACGSGRGAGAAPQSIAV